MHIYIHFTYDRGNTEKGIITVERYYLWASFQDTNISHSFSLTCILIKSNSYFDDDDNDDSKR